MSFILMGHYLAGLKSNNFPNETNFFFLQFNEWTILITLDKKEKLRQNI